MHIASKTLYLGLKAEKNTFHYPVIKTIDLPISQEIFSLWKNFTHIIFTSKETVRYWKGPWDKIPIAIGSATATALKQKGLIPLVAPVATQEGIITLLQTIKNGHFFYPHSKRARPLLRDYMKKHQIPYFSFPLYDTVLQKLEPVPDLNDFDEIVFTSPSTVEGFLQIYKSLPQDKKLTAIGPITKAALIAQGKEGDFDFGKLPD